jgi:hypothetical protein
MPNSLGVKIGSLLMSQNAIDNILEQCTNMFHERDVDMPAYRLSLTGYTLFSRRSREDEDPLSMIKKKKKVY